MGLPVVAEVVRSGFVEGTHSGSMIALRADGGAALALGEPNCAVLPRSANKPLQAVALLRCGLDLDGLLLAIAAASHSGEPRHLELVRELLATAGLDETALRNTPALPLSEPAMRDWLRAGGEPARLPQNCSGKHAGMLAACVANRWPLDSYLEPDAPLQVAIRRTVEDLASERVAATAVDGCGAPLFAISLAGLARAFARLTTAAAGTPERRVADAMRAFPEVVGGTGRDVTRVMLGVPGLLAKDGAEGVYAAADADGRAVAVKVTDGGDRARGPLLVAGLRALGVVAPILDELARTPVLGGGRPVGEVRAVLR